MLRGIHRLGFGGAVHAVGAYIAPAGLVPSIFSLRFIPGAYDVTAAHLVTRGVFTNTSRLGPYRGAGRPEATYLIERLLDEAALLLGLDRAQRAALDAVTASRTIEAEEDGCLSCLHDD